MPEIISFVKKEPNKKHLRITNSQEEYSFGLCQDTNRRDYQEDAMAWKTYPTNYFVNHSPLELGMKLWSTYQLLNQEILRRLKNEKKEERKIGSTACTTLYDGDEYLITANIADSCSFAVFYDAKDLPVKVIRLNKHLHKAEDVLEQERIEKAGGSIIQDGPHLRVKEGLIVSRALGDFYCKGICSDARIDILNLREEKNRLKTPAQRIQVITVSDGFTDGACTNREQDMENFLFQCLLERKGLTESELAEALVEAVKQIKVSDDYGPSRSKVRDNISIAIQTIKPQMPFMIGVFDGHGGGAVARFCARNLFATFDKLNSENHIDFKVLKFKPYQMKHEFLRDHQHLLQGKFKADWVKYLALSEIMQQTTLCFDSFRSKWGKKNKIFKGLVKTINDDLNESSIEKRLHSILDYLCQTFHKEQSNFDYLMQHTSSLAQDFCKLMEHHLKQLHGLIKMDQYGFIKKWFQLTDVQKDVLKYEDYKFFSISESSSCDADEERNRYAPQQKVSLKQASDEDSPLNESEHTNNTNRL